MLNKEADFYRYFTCLQRGYFEQEFCLRGSGKGAELMAERIKSKVERAVSTLSNLPDIR
ncbi:hypothetical protein [Tatumella morbirosei]|uniref:hypothetical protein n=1 Tax=Tatumella morbirosei TaxID=642227 RepID=UPI000AFCBC46|nr:hypothetical protein [Tatumella morbirosei]